jgi:hypothetical protein
MKALVGLLFLVSASAFADDATDRAAIARTVAAINQSPQRPDIFTGDADGRSVPEELSRGKTPSFQVRSPSPDPDAVVVSREPWGEATIQFRPAVVEMKNPRIVSGAIRFITADVALADGTCTYTNESAVTQITPLSFVMKKEGDVWKIASLRVLR